MLIRFNVNGKNRIKANPRRTIIHPFIICLFFYFSQKIIFIREKCNHIISIDVELCNLWSESSSLFKDNNLAVVESLLGGCIAGTFFHLFAGQPLTIIGRESYKM